MKLKYPKRDLKFSRKCHRTKTYNDFGLANGTANTLTNKQWLQNLKSSWSRPESGLSESHVDRYIGKTKVIISFCSMAHWQDQSLCKF